MMGTLVVKGLRGDLILRLRDVELISNSSLISLKPLIFNDYEMFIIVILQSFTLLLLQSYLIRHLIIRSTFKDTQRVLEDSRNSRSTGTLEHSEGI